MVKNRTEKSRVDFHACLDSSKPQCKYKKKIVEDFWKKVTFCFSYFHMKTVPPVNIFNFLKY